jgi:hypothetical protein
MLLARMGPDALTVLPIEQQHTGPGEDTIAP